MAQDRITQDDVLEKFLVTENYGENPKNWPQKTIVACKINCTDAKGKKWASYQVYRNNSKYHAGEILIEYLRWVAYVLEAKKIKLEIYMNYSPCSKCSKTILDYIKAMKSLKREIEITIAFANFYETHVYQGFSQENANENIEGLKGLYRKPNVTLQLIGEHVPWGTFLDMNEFFSLNEREKEQCLRRAERQRQLREREDRAFFAGIFGVEDIREGMSRVSVSTQAETSTGSSSDENSSSSDENGSQE